MRLRRADACAGELLARVAARRYGALLAVVLLSVVLISLSWLGRALRDTATARIRVEHDQIVMAVALQRDRARVDALTGRLAASQVSAGRRQQASAAVPSQHGEPTCHTAERKPTMTLTDGGADPAHHNPKGRRERSAHSPRRGRCRSPSGILGGVGLAVQPMCRSAS